MSGDTLRTALAQALAATISDYDKPWHAQSILATPTGKALADVVAKTEAFAAAQRQWLIDGHIGLVHEGYELMTAIDRLREATEGAAFPAGPIKPQPHQHSYTWGSTTTGDDSRPPLGTPCTSCGATFRGAPDEQ